MPPNVIGYAESAEKRGAERDVKEAGPGVSLSTNNASKPTNEPNPAAVGSGVLRSSAARLLGHLPLLVGFVCLSVAYFIWGWSNEVSDFQGDSSVYMLAARYFSPFWPSSPVFAEFTKNMAYPPLFPLLIGLLGGSLLAGHLLVIATLLAAILCLYAWLRLEGLAAGTSACACLVFALMPGTYLQALNIWTENPYLFLSLLAIVLENRAAAAGSNRPALWRGASVAIAAAGLVRAAALPLMLAYTIRLAMIRPRQWHYMIAAICVPFALWATWGKFHRPPGLGYAAQWSSSYARDPFGTMFHQIGTETALVLHSWAQAWLADGSGGNLHYFVIAAGVTCGVGCLWRLVKLRFDALYVALYTILLLVWPFPAEARRLSYVLIPPLLAQGLLLLQTLGLRNRGESGRTFFPALLLGALAVAILPSLILTLHRFNEPLPPELGAARHIEDWYGDDLQKAINSTHSFTSILADLHHSSELVPDNECIFAIKPSVISLYSDRLSYTPPPISASDDAFESGIKKCKYAYLLTYISPSFAEPYYPLNRLNGRISPLSVAEDGEGAHKKTFSALVEIHTP